MSISEMFSTFIDNLKIDDEKRETISGRYGEITSALNQQFRDTDSKTANCLQVGSFGRCTAIKGISDLDMLYIMPAFKWDDYNKQGGQSNLLSETRDAILARYPSTKIKVDRLVVTVTYTDFHIEVQPVFEQADGSFKYPDTKDGGSWKITKPRDEMNEISSMNQQKNENLRRLCKMVRAWKNKHGVAMGGLVIDTLAYNFLKSTSNYDNKSFMYYNWLSRDFFKYLSELPEQSEYNAPGSNQRVKVKKKFQRKAKKSYELCCEAINAEKQKNVNDKWRKVYGSSFPNSSHFTMESVSFPLSTWKNTEEFIEYKFPVDIQEDLEIDCEVKQNGFRKFFLRDLLKKDIPLKSQKSLVFSIKNISIEEPYDIYWKVLNRGDEAKRRDCIRGQIVKDSGYKTKQESTDFRGDHIVECYCVKDGVVIAKDRIHVPIVADGSDYD